MTAPTGSALAVFLAMGAALPAAEMHVAPDGDDTVPGTAARPLRSLAAAQRSAREVIARGGPVSVLLHRGTFYLPETLVFTAEDSGREGAPVTWAAAPGEEVVVSGGVRMLLAWRPWRDGIMQATVPAGLAIDQLFVDCFLLRASRASARAVDRTSMRTRIFWEDGRMSTSAWAGT